MVNFLRAAILFLLLWAGFDPSTFNAPFFILLPRFLIFTKSQKKSFDKKMDLTLKKFLKEFLNECTSFVGEFY